MVNKLLSTVCVAMFVVAAGCASPLTKTPGAQTSWSDKLGASLKSGTEKVTSALSPKKTPGASTETTGTRKPGPGVFVAIAQMKEKQGNAEEAEIQYQKALNLDSNHLGALLGYAHLKDAQGDFTSAMKFYQRGVKAHPNDPSAHNDLGLCYHRRGMLPEATKSLEKAVELQPARRLYRGNLAAVLVEQGKNDEALKQLIAGHGEAVGHYNLAYLLVQKKDKATAEKHFRKALEKDPSLTPARDWIAQLHPAPAVGRPPMQAPHMPPAAMAGPAPAGGPPQQQVAAQPPAQPPARPQVQAPVEPLPPTGDRMATRPQGVAPRPAPAGVFVPRVTSPAPNEPQASAPPSDAPIARTARADGFMRASIGGTTADDNSAGESELQFVPSRTR